MNDVKIDVCTEETETSRTCQNASQEEDTQKPISVFTINVKDEDEVGKKNTEKKKEEKTKSKHNHIEDKFIFQSKQF